MEDNKRNEMNQKIDVLFEQIYKLDDEAQEKAAYALSLWKFAMTGEFLGLGPMAARCEYKAAYSALKGMGLEVGGMIEPYESSNDNVTGAPISAATREKEQQNAQG